MYQEVIGDGNKEVCGMWERHNSEVQSLVPESSGKDGLSKMPEHLHSQDQKKERYVPRKESVLERRSDALLGVCLPTKTRTPESQQEWVYEKGDTGTGREVG